MAEYSNSQVQVTLPAPGPDGLEVQELRAEGEAIVGLLDRLIRAAQNHRAAIVSNIVNAAIINPNFPAFRTTTGFADLGYAVDSGTDALERYWSNASIVLGGEDFAVSYGGNAEDEADDGEED